MGQRGGRGQRGGGRRHQGQRSGMHWHFFPSSTGGHFHPVRGGGAGAARAAVGHALEPLKHFISRLGGQETAGGAGAARAAVGHAQEP